VRSAREHIALNGLMLARSPPPCLLGDRRRAGAAAADTRTSRPSRLSGQGQLDLRGRWRDGLWEPPESHRSKDLATDPASQDVMTGSSIGPPHCAPGASLPRATVREWRQCLGSRYPVRPRQSLCRARGDPQISNDIIVDEHHPRQDFRTINTPIRFEKTLAPGERGAHARRAYRGDSARRWFPTTS
jgi:hypothetical protein